MIDPISLGIMGGSTLLGGILNLLGGDDEQERIDQYLKTLEEQKGKYIADAARRKIEMMRMNEASKKRTLAKANQRASQFGYDPVASTYANEEGADNALYEAMNALEREKQARLMDFDNRMAEVKLNRPNQSGFELFAEGGLAGLGLGSNIAGMLNIGGGIEPASGGGQDGKVTGKNPKTGETGNTANKNNNNLNINETNKNLTPSAAGNMMKLNKMTNPTLAQNAGDYGKLLNFGMYNGVDMSMPTFEKLMADQYPDWYRLKNFLI